MPKLVASSRSKGPTASVKKLASTVANIVQKATPRRSSRSVDDVSAIVIAAPPATTRPVRKAKAIALDTKIWNRDLPNGRKRVHSDTEQHSSKKSKREGDGKNVAAVVEGKINTAPGPAVKATPDVADSAISELTGRAVVASTPSTGAKRRPTLPRHQDDPAVIVGSVDPEAEDNDEEDEEENDLTGKHGSTDDEEEEDDDDNEATSSGRHDEVPAWTTNVYGEDRPTDSFNSDSASEDEEHPAPKQAVKAANANKGSTRAAKAKLEQPGFEESDIEEEPVVATGGNGSSDDERGNDASDTESDIEDGWPAWTDLILNAHGGTNLKDQPVLVRLILGLAIKMVEVDAAFDTPYPEVEDKLAYLRSVLIACAMDVHNTIADRIRDDWLYAKRLMTHPANRLSHYRTHVKDAVVPRLDAAYSLRHWMGVARSVLEIKTLVANLLDSRKYMYPTTITGTEVRIIKSQPFQAPMIIQTLQAAYFGTSTSVGIRHADRFRSSLPDKPTEHEIPICMLAMAAAAVNAVLLCWTTGVYISAPFHVDTGIALYQEQVMTLELILKQAGPKRAHRMMANILIAVRATAGVVSANAVDAANEVDFANMPE
ncbi:hypothetical protein EUX98_g4657 [Antrodiella citrinella]|uniref:DUF6532 domain-containing protein n=1 Tax=Antrodiella citrinella TaxID=2447956 RepID=A0A4S4MUE3_9APHY|nr:hypothetical protein EUX98_g4657 [Antrodiella citrinella]